MAFTKAYQLRKLNDTELMNEIYLTKKELFDLRIQKSVRASSFKPHIIKKTRHKLAQLLTIEGERRRQENSFVRCDPLLYLSRKICYPKNVFKGKSFELKVNLTPMPEKSEKFSPFTTNIKLGVSPNDFIVHGSNKMKILVFNEEQHETIDQQLIFKLEPISQGKKTINLEFSLDYDYLGEIDLVTTVHVESDT